LVLSRSVFLVARTYYSSVNPSTAHFRCNQASLKRQLGVAWLSVLFGP